MEDPAARGHPLYVPGTDRTGIPQAVLVVHDPVQHVGHRLDTPVGMHGKTRQIVAGVVGSEVIEEKERIEVVEPPGGNAPAKPDPCPFPYELRLDDLLDRPGIHADALPLATPS